MMFSLSKVATFALLALGVAASAVPAKRAETAPEILDELAEAVAPIAAQFGEFILGITMISTQCISAYSGAHARHRDHPERAEHCRPDHSPRL